MHLQACIENIACFVIIHKKYYEREKEVMARKIISLVLLIMIITLCFSYLSACKSSEEVHKGPVLYQLGPDNQMLMMGYVIKTSNNKYIVIDGGGVGKKSSGYLLSALQEITGQEVPEIEAWFLTHLHEDHVTQFCMLTEYYDEELGEIKIKDVYFNFPSQDFMDRSEAGQSAYLRNDVRRGYDRIKGDGEFDKINGKNVFEGDVIEIDDVRIDILLTATDEERESTINDTSLIFRATVEDQTILFLADSHRSQGNRLLKKYGDTLKSDIVQMSHHGQDGVMKKVYEAIAPTMCLWPSPDWVFNNTSGTLQSFETRQWMMDMNIKYHFISGIDFTQSFNLPVKFDKLKECDITPPQE